MRVLAHLHNFSKGNGKFNIFCQITNNWNSLKNKWTNEINKQVVLVSRPLLQHVRANANDPLGQLLDANRVVGLLLAVDSQQDVTELHRSGMQGATYFYSP